MPDMPPFGNTASGGAHGTLLQARDIHGGVHIHTVPAAGPIADVCLDAPRTATRIRDRVALLGELEAAMAGGDARPHVLTGPGGIGKSTVAAALAERAAAAGRAVFWIRPGSVAPSLLEAAVELGADRTEAERLASSPRRAARWVWRRLDAAPEPWLLVFDNADRPEELDAENRPGDGLGWLRGSARGFVLVTTRVAAPEVWAPSVPHPVDALDAADAADVLSDYAGVADIGADSGGARALARRLGGFPLALALAGQVMATHRTMFADFQALHTHLADSVGRIDELARPLVRQAPGRGTLSGTWEVSVELLAGTPQAEPLLGLLSILGAEGMEVPLRRLPVELLRGGRVDAGEEPLDEAALARALNALAVQGLLTLTETRGERALRVHPLIGETTRGGLGERAVEAAEEAERLLRSQDGRDLAMEHTAYRALAEVRARALGEDHPDTLSAEVRRVRVGLQSGDAEGAEAEFGQLASRAEAALGAEHRVTLQARHHRGDALIDLGRLEEAEAVFRAELEVRERVYGPEDEGTLSARHQVAHSARRKGDLETAAQMFTAIVRVKERIASPDDRTLVNARFNLADISRIKGDWDAAEEEFRHVIARDEAVFGVGHPEAVYGRFHLALTLIARGDTDSADAEPTGSSGRGRRRSGAIIRTSASGAKPSGKFKEALNRMTLWIGGDMNNCSSFLAWWSPSEFKRQAECLTGHVVSGN